jgi:hypothetical protein
MRSERDSERRLLIVACSLWAVLLGVVFTFIYLGPERFDRLLHALWP